MPIVKISPTVIAAQRLDPRFIQLQQSSEAFFNCRKQCCFGEKCRSLLCLHEGAHAYFARKAGATNIKFYGPEMFWDSRPEYDCPAISKSSVSWDEPCVPFSVEVAKADLAGFICRREMSDTPNDEIAIGSDLATCRERFDRHIGTGDDAFKALLKTPNAACWRTYGSHKLGGKSGMRRSVLKRKSFLAPS
jgi:hypothetical protein